MALGSECLVGRVQNCQLQLGWTPPTQKSSPPNERADVGVVPSVHEFVRSCFQFSLDPCIPRPNCSAQHIPYQFVLLLALFVKPMLLPQGSTQSGGAVYRRVVNRNILCTVCIVLTYTTTTVVVVLAQQRSSTKVQSVLQITTARYFISQQQFCVCTVRQLFDKHARG